MLINEYRLTPIKEKIKSFSKQKWKSSSSARAPKTCRLKNRVIFRSQATVYNATMLMQVAQSVKQGTKSLSAVRLSPITFPHQ